MYTQAMSLLHLQPNASHRRVTDLPTRVQAKTIYNKRYILSSLVKNIEHIRCNKCAVATVLPQLHNVLNNEGKITIRNTSRNRQFSHNTLSPFFKLRTPPGIKIWGLFSLAPRPR